MNYIPRLSSCLHIRSYFEVPNVMNLEADHHLSRGALLGHYERYSPEAYPFGFGAGPLYRLSAGQSLEALVTVVL